jgi:hypothetical protein
VGKKSSRIFDLCSATNIDFDPFGALLALASFRRKRRVACPRRRSGKRAWIFDIAISPGVFRILRHRASSRREFDVRDPASVVRGRSPPCRKKNRKVVDTKKMRG